MSDLVIPYGYTYDAKTNSIVKKSAVTTDTTASVFGNNATQTAMGTGIPITMQSQAAMVATPTQTAIQSQTAVQAQAPATQEASVEEPPKKLKWYEKLGHAVLGVGKSLAGAVCSIVPGASIVAKTLGWKDAPSFSLKNAVLAAGTIALSIVCPPAGVAIAAVGIGMGAYQVKKGFDALSAAEKTVGTEDDIAACENIGGGFLQIGLSAVGAKVGLKSCGNFNAASAIARTETGAAINAAKAEFVAATGSKAKFQAIGTGVKGIGSGAKTIGKGLLNDTTSSLARNTGKLGANISENLEGTTTIGEKATAFKDGFVDTAKGSRLYNNISKYTPNGKIKGIYKGTKETLSETRTNLKKAGYEKVSNDANTANENLGKGFEKLENSGIEKLQELKESPLTTSEELTAFNEKLNSIDKKNLSKEDKLALENLKDLAKQAQKKNEKLEAIYKKQDEKINDYEEQLTAQHEEYEAAIATKENELKTQVDEGKITDREMDTQLSEYKSEQFQNIKDEYNRLIKEQSAVLKNGTGASAIKGLRSNIRTWVRNTTENNAKIATDTYREKMGIATNTDDAAQSVKITREDIANEKASTKEMKKISNASEEVNAAKKRLDEATEEEIQKATKELTKAQKKLADVNKKIIDDANDKVKNATDNLNKANNKKNATPEEIASAKKELEDATANQTRSINNTKTALDDASQEYINAGKKLKALKLEKNSQSPKAAFIKGNVFQTTAHNLGYNNMSQYDGMPTWKDYEAAKAAAANTSYATPTYTGGGSLSGIICTDNPDGSYSFS